MTTTLPPRASLLGLPAELRVAIFEYALQHVHTRLRDWLLKGKPSSHQYCLHWPWSIMHINRQIRDEVVPTFYQHVRFEIFDGATEKRLREWLAVIGEDAVARIRTIGFECYAMCSMYGLTLE